MWNDEQRRFSAEVTAADAAATRCGEPRPGPGLRGVGGRLRPYRDVRAGFERWRRIALDVWAARDAAGTQH